MRKQFSTNKSEMDAISVAELNIRDIVLVEGRIRQHTTKQDQAQKGWMEWGVKFELVCVLLLHDRLVDMHEAEYLSPKAFCVWQTTRLEIFMSHCLISISMYAIYVWNCILNFL